VPPVSPEKYASAIAQKKMLLPATSVNGSVRLAPLHAPVSARSLTDATINTRLAANKIAVCVTRRFAFILFLPIPFLTSSVDLESASVHPN
jgi:hypothetical protein